MWFYLETMAEWPGTVITRNCFLIDFIKIVLVSTTICNIFFKYRLNMYLQYIDILILQTFDSDFDLCHLTLTSTFDHRAKVKGNNKWSPNMVFANPGFDMCEKSLVCYFAIPCSLKCEIDILQNSNWSQHITFINGLLQFLGTDLYVKQLIWT